MRRIIAATILAIVALIATSGSNGTASPEQAAGDAAVFGPIGLPSMAPGATVYVQMRVTNAGSTTWSSPAIALAYHWYTTSGALVVWDGQRTALGTVDPGAFVWVGARVVVPSTPRDYILAFEVVREGVSWFGNAVTMPARVEGETYRALYTVGAGASVPVGDYVEIPVSVTNAGTATWHATGAGLVALAYHVYDAYGQLVAWDGERTRLVTDVAPGETRVLNMRVSALPGAGDYTIRVDLVHEGFAWFSTLGSPLVDTKVRVWGGFGAVEAPDVMWAGAYGTANVSVTNTTRSTWRAGGTNPVRLSYHVYRSSDGLLVWDGERTSLPFDIAPGATVYLKAYLRAPATPGDYVYAWDLVEEGVSWLSSRGVAAVSDLVTARALPASLIATEWSRIPTTDRVVALTFDCGANADGAQKILDALAQKNVPATFFLTGNFVRSFWNASLAIADRYPVGDHTMTHPDLRTLTDADVANEIHTGELELFQLPGDPHPLFRFPYGGSDARTIAIANAYGYGGIRWTVDTLGWEGTSGGQSVATVTSRVLASLQPGEIVLMHVGSNPDDRSTLDADALAGVIDQIRAQGYTFTTLTDYVP
ncbi:MAG TPA: polysaccharide deacetylase family protein [Candidatus Limnocylindria bacterium]